ncbi:MAG: hypothetical protein RLZZ299_356 [Pseudomonadota bacterium]
MPLATAWAEVERAVAETARFPPGALSFVDWAAVERGELAVSRGAVTVAVGRVRAPRTAVWLAMTHDTPAARLRGLVERALVGRWGASTKRLYQRIDLPWPVQDRHWVIESRTNLALSARAPSAWERAWTTVPAALSGTRDADPDPAAWDAAAAVPRNDGAWLLVDAGPDATLAVYRVAVDLGGAVPTAAVSGWTARSLEEVYRTLESDARALASHGEAGCTTQPGGDGRPIPCGPR